MNVEEQLQIAIRLAVGALGGLAVGIEREWSGRSESQHPRFAGVRTFLLIGLLASLSSVFIERNWIASGISILVGSILLVVIAYSASAFRGDRESTTEFAALVVIAAGGLAGTGQLALASGITVFVALILVEKIHIHSLVYRIQSEHLVAGLRFAVLALVVLPLLPTGPFGPGPGIRPRELWALVLLFSGLSFAALIARRVLGTAHGYTVAGLLGGLISSTLVTLNFSRESRMENSDRRSLALGVIAACTILFTRVAFLSFILNPPIGIAALPALAISFLVGALVVLIFRRKTTSETNDTAMPSKNPLRLLTAIQMVLTFQLALFAFYWLRDRFGSVGVFVSSAIAGLTDVDTLTFMIGKQKHLDIPVAVQALMIGVLANNFLKLVLALAIGKGAFRVIVSIGLIAVSAALVIAMMFI